ncbi:hypothetical protein KsCSTR_34190 [Candidatus Kuenenia stuttgartiensis]|uniref:Uncharacterized protein n=1 Tax=Kuenenia stuttgartiensis TaxID=174633 RepID=Q1Q478_KUEST|nr:hypothetical protein KsCSTR_34190 [Candidatus Kuenenia stuttgartiensis]CAJ74824.1 unknown protein [Candidatus Kuenenia stuttgartiensis]
MKINARSQAGAWQQALMLHTYLITSQLHNSEFLVRHSLFILMSDVQRKQELLTLHNQINP